MAAFLFPELQFTDNTTGAPLAFGKVYTYVAGTSTPLETFTDHTGGISAGLYVVLDAQGRPNSGNGIWLGNTSFYKFIIKDANANTIQTVDYISPASLSVTGSLITVNAESQLLSSRQLTASQGVSLTDGGALSTLAIKADIPSLTADATPDLAADYVMTYDASAALNKKVLLNNVLTSPPSINSQTGTTYTAVAADTNKVITLTTQATHTLSLTAAATLGAGWHCRVFNENSGSLVIDPNGAETINGGATLTVPTKAVVDIVCTGTTFYAAVSPGWSTTDNNLAVTSGTTTVGNLACTGFSFTGGGTASITGALSVQGVSCTAINSTTISCTTINTSNNNVTMGTGNISSVGSVTASGTITTPAFRLTRQTPAQITSNQNDYAITVTSGSAVRISSDAARNITGLAAATTDYVLLLVNVGAFAITLKHQDAASSVNNRFLFTGAADYVLAAEESVMLWYDGTSGKFRRVT